MRNCFPIFAVRLFALAARRTTGVIAAETTDNYQQQNNRNSYEENIVTDTGTGDNGFGAGQGCQSGVAKRQDRGGDYRQRRFPLLLRPARRQDRFHADWTADGPLKQGLGQERQDFGRQDPTGQQHHKARSAAETVGDKERLHGGHALDEGQLQGGVPCV